MLFCVGSISDGQPTFLKGEWVDDLPKVMAKKLDLYTVEDDAPKGSMLTVDEA